MVVLAKVAVVVVVFVFAVGVFLDGFGVEGVKELLGGVGALGVLVVIGAVAGLVGRFGVGGGVDGIEGPVAQQLAGSYCGLAGGSSTLRSPEGLRVIPRRDATSRAMWLDAKP